MKIFVYNENLLVNNYEISPIQNKKNLANFKENSNVFYVEKTNFQIIPLILDVIKKLECHLFTFNLKKMFVHF